MGKSMNKTEDVTSLEKIMIVIPTRGEVHLRTSRAVAIAHRRGACFMFTIGRPEDVNRNKAIRNILSRYTDEEFEYVAFLDSDVAPPDDWLDKLLAMKADIACGLYPLLVNNGLYWSWLKWDNDKKSLPLQGTKPNGIFDADACGAGCMLIRTEVLRKLGYPWFRWIEKPNGKTIGEDVYFFAKAKDAGYEVKVDSTLLCGHMKEINLMGIMELCDEEAESCVVS